MLLAREFVPAASWRVRVTVAVVVVPGRPDIPRIGFEEQSRHREETPAWRFTHRAIRQFASLRHWPLLLETGFAIKTCKVVLGHQCTTFSSSS
jgi:hypothetical protein